MASPDPDIRARARELIAILAAALGEQLAASVLIGGQAVNLIDEQRLTYDIDLLVRPAAGILEQIRDRLLAAGCTLVSEQRADPSGEVWFLRLNHPATGLGIDIESATTDYEDGVIDRGLTLDPSQPIRSATPEDLLVLKLIANRSKDHRDLVGLASMEGLDWAYVHHWADVWDISDRLEALLTLTKDERRPS